MSRAETSERAEDSDSDVTPSASFITTRNRKIYSINEKNMKMKLHADFLKTCIEEDIIPKGLTVDLTSTLEDKDNEIFNNKWKQILKNCSRELMSCFVEHYERQITLNATVIADTYESLDKIKGWTERDKTYSRAITFLYSRHDRLYSTNKSLGKTTRRMLFSNIRCFKLIYKY